MQDSKNFPHSGVPVLSLRHVVLFPAQSMPVWVSAEKSAQAIQAAQDQGGWVFVVKTKSSERIDKPENLYHVGTLAKIEQVKSYSNETLQVSLRSAVRFEVEQFDLREGFLVVSGGQKIDKFDASEATMSALEKSLRESAYEIFGLLPPEMARFQDLIDSIKDPLILSYTLTQHLGFDFETKQKILEEDSVKNRLLKILDALVKLKDELSVQKEIGSKISSELSRKQRDAILREQLKAIQEQLGEGDQGSRNDELREQIEAAHMPKEVYEVAMDQMRRLESAGSSSPESQVIRNYLELLCALPWAEPVSSPIDLDEAKKILDQDHFGLDKIKNRILEHLAVLKLKKDARGSILLFVGPPGVGKTSLGKSIARALERDFVRASLGGVRDEAEIRGHRRTYVGAMPGRIINSIKRVKSRNAVFLLDEIDKLSQSYAGDPASALLEVLDPEQNSNFLDHYLDVPFDLSKIIFIATANTLESIPGPLLDRMEIIRLSGYTSEEKLEIAKRYLIPKQLSDYGISEDQMKIKDDELRALIELYTKEAGVRDLQRKIASLARAKAREIVKESKDFNPSVELEEIERVLGAPIYLKEEVHEQHPSGVVTGLAWTPFGGEILMIESSMMSGQGKLNITGQLGDVMKESSQIALSLARAHLQDPRFQFSNTDIHMHVPAGAIPKDGPSAGVAMLTSLVSLFLKKPIRSHLAMTGEITLRGAVLPVGGIKEKLLAAYRAGVKEVILSKRNEKDLRDLPEEIRAGLQIHFVENVSQVLEISMDISSFELERIWRVAA